MSMTEPLTATPAQSSLTQSLEEVIALARRNSLTRDNPALADLPAWWREFRDHQRIAIREILLAYEEGAECVVLDAPTGSGKTVVGEAVRRLLPGTLAGQLGGRNATSYICSSKALQEQFVRDYPYAKVLKGRSNYATELYPERFGGKDGLSAADCTKSTGDPESCLWCASTHLCPYERAKSDALRSGLAVLNTSYFLSECNGPGRFSRGGLVIADEADTLESELMGHVEVRISERRLKQYGLGVPRYVTKEESWREWAEEAYEKVRNTRLSLPSHDEVKANRERKRHSLLVERLKGLAEEIQAGGWVYTGSRDFVAFKPVTVSAFGPSKLWRHGDKWLLMSATVISSDELLESLGWDEEKEWRLVKVPSTFAKENRKVVVAPAANMSFKGKEEGYGKLIDAIVTIIGRHPDDRMLIHSTNYECTRELRQRLEVLPAELRVNSTGHPRHIITYSESNQKEARLADFLSNPAAIMIAPSMGRGVDLPGDACRVQIIAKVPFGNLRDKQISTRLYGTGREGKVWYAVNAIRTIVQMTGRAVRGPNDYAITYILDSQFVTNLWASNKRLFPEYWKEALEWRTKGL